jgi:hypothetical protein
MAIINMSYPKPRATQTKLAAMTYADTTARELFVLPKNAVIVGIYVIGATASNAATTGTLSIGSSATATEYMSGFDVKTAADGVGYNPAGGKAVGSAMATPLTTDVHVYGIYAETGAGASAGAWTIKIEYFVTGPGETL